MTNARPAIRRNRTTQINIQGVCFTWHDALYGGRRRRRGDLCDFEIGRIVFVWPRKTVERERKTGGAAAFIGLVQFNPHIVPAWIAVVIIGREFLVSGLRSIAAQQGFTIDASDLGKVKMVVQIVVVVICILERRWHAWAFGSFIWPWNVLAVVGIWFMVSLSLVSAVDYFVAFWKKIDRQVVKRRRRAFVLSRRRKQTDVAAT